ncbi:MAG: PQQ-binding-like beta-propeller repeat protein [Bacteriovoracaceae bacterium]
MKKNFVPNILLLAFISGCSAMGSFKDKFKPTAVRREEKNFKVIWSRHLDPEYDVGNLPIGLSSPFMYSSLLFIGDLKGRMTAHNLEDGREIWQQTEKDELGSIAGIYRDHLIYGSYNGRAIARHYLTGELKYSVDLGAPVESKPIIYRDRLFYHVRNHQVASLDAATGKILWTYRRSVPFTTTLQRVSDVFPLDNKLIVGFADGDLVALSVEDGNVLWERKLATGVKFIDVDASPVLFNGKLYAGSVAGALSVINPESGALERTYDYSISRSPVIIDGQLLVGTINGMIYVIDSTGSQIREKKLSAQGISSIVEWKGGLVVSTLGGKLYFLNKKNLDVIETYSLGSAYSSVMGELAVLGDYLSVFSSRNHLYIFR